MAPTGGPVRSVYYFAKYLDCYFASITLNINSISCQLFIEGGGLLQNITKLVYSLQLDEQRKDNYHNKKYAKK